MNGFDPTRMALRFPDGYERSVADFQHTTWSIRMGDLGSAFDFDVGDKKGPMPQLEYVLASMLWIPVQHGPSQRSDPHAWFCMFVEAQEMFSAPLSALKNQPFRLLIPVQFIAGEKVRLVSGEDGVLVCEGFQSKIPG